MTYRFKTVKNPGGSIRVIDWYQSLFHDMLQITELLAQVILEAVLKDKYYLIVCQ